MRKIKIDPDPASYAFKTEAPIRWGDMDALGHVNNTVYLQLFEICRIAYLENLNTQNFMEKENVGPILASTTIDFEYPLSFPDTVTLCAKAVALTPARIVMHHLIISGNGTVAARGVVTVVCFNFEKKRPVALPAEVRNAIMTFDNIAPKSRAVNAF